MRQQLTRRESAALSAIRAHVDEAGYPPTVRELGAAIGLSSCSSVAFVLNNLQLKGYIRRLPDKPRAIQVVEQ